MSAGKPEAEFAIEPALVRRLLEEQHPDLAALPLSLLAEGWDNVLYRLGHEYTVRLPRRELAARLIEQEQRWLPQIAAGLPIPIPAPLRIGVPGAGYPWHWSLLPWFDGTCADEQPPDATEAPRFARFLLALHQPAPADAPENAYRGGPLVSRAAMTLERLERVRSRTDLITTSLMTIWEAALAAKPTLDPRWLHGDLHAQNVLVRDGRFSAVIDWGDITGGDVATDLASVWHLFSERAARQDFLDTYGPDTETLTRARGWAFAIGVVLLDSGLINSPRHASQGADVLRRLAADA